MPLSLVIKKRDQMLTVECGHASSEEIVKRASEA
jgi:hypothetical protein